MASDNKNKTQDNDKKKNETLSGNKKLDMRRTKIQQWS